MARIDPDEGPDPDIDGDLFDEDDGANVYTSCPNCRELIADVAEQCPMCGEWLTEADRVGASRRSRGRVGTIVVVLIVVLLVLSLLF